MTRRQSLQICMGALACPDPGGATPVEESPFPFRGYYITFMRMPVMGLKEWKTAVDAFAEDGINLLVLWVPGGFRSRQFPQTWRYNEDHSNVRRDFLRDLIDYAHTKQIRTLLGFTPFGYDGVNRMTLEHPEWKAVKADGKPVDEFGIHSWGWSLCPAQAGAREFMGAYLREMIFDFYPNADGLMVESSDYNVCQCAECRTRPYEEEFKLARQISQELWKARPDALILMYPHYFTGRKVPGLETAAVRQEFDPRWGLMFTPHSAHFDTGLIRQARCSLFSGPEAALGTPAAIAEAVKSAREHRVNGYLPSLEAFSYEVTRPEGGEPFFPGRRRRPMGLDPDKEGRQPYAGLPARVQRFAAKEFSRRPELAFSEFQQRLGETFFGKNFPPEAVSDLLELQRIWNFEAEWYWSSPLLDPAFYQARSKRLQWPPEKHAVYQRNLDLLRIIAGRYQNRPFPPPGKWPDWPWRWLTAGEPKVRHPLNSS